MKAKTVVFVALCMWGGGITASSSVIEGQWLKKKKKVDIVQKKDSTNSDYAKLTRGAVGKPGLFMTWYKTDKNELYFELPDSAFNHTYMLANRIARTSDTQDFVAGQMVSAPLMIRFSKDNQKVYMHKVQYQNEVNAADPIAAAFHRNFADPVLKGFKIVARNKGSVVINMTDFFGTNERIISPIKPDNPLEKLLGGSKSLKGTFQADGSNIMQVKTFPKNIEVESLLSYNLTPLNRPYTVVVHRSLFVLPDDPMPRRLQDNRVGFFNDMKELYTSGHDRIVERAYINRWRIRPKQEDMERYFRGELVEPEKPLVFYVDSAFPDKWRSAVKQGIEDWNRAFEAAGFKNVVRAVDYPTDDPSFDPDDMRYSCVKYAATPIANAMGPSYVDPRTGEILTADVIWYHNVVSLLHDWRFVQTGAVDPRVRKSVFDDEVMRESIRYVAVHEIGHTLGLMHNMGASYAFPVDSLRSPSFTQKYGTTPSVMDYARNNFVAQPGDVERGVKLTPPVLGVYDIYAINWGYRLIPDADTPDDEKSVLDRWIAEKAADPMYEFGAQQAFATVDPTDQTEDLGNDHIKSGNLAIANLKLIMAHLPEWMHEQGARYDDMEKMYNAIVQQYTRHLRHVMPYIGGIRYREVRQGDGAMGKNYVDKAHQQAAMHWLLEQVRTYDAWLTPKELFVNFEAGMNMNDKLRSSVVGCLLSPTALYRIEEGGQYDPEGNYTLSDYIDDVMKELFKQTYAGRRLTDADRSIEAAAINLMIRNSGLAVNAAKKSSSSALDAYEELMQETVSSEPVCSHADDAHSFVRLNFSLPSLPKEKLEPMMSGCLHRVLRLYQSRRLGASGTDRDFYDYQITMIQRTLSAD